MPHVDCPQSICRCGVARCDITPPVGIYHRMWGAATHDRATGVHRPLTATALVFQPIDQPTGVDGQQVLVAVDLCLLWGREMEDLLAGVCAASGLAREQLAITFSHTHAAGLMGLERASLPGGELIPPFLASLAERIAGIIEVARSSVQKVTITYGTGHCTLAAHRDFWDGESRQWVCGFNPQGPSDATVLVARIADIAGKTLATVVNYACHPTTLAWDNTLIGPDYVGSVREVVERGGTAPCVFIQGCSGDLGPREGFVGDLEVAERNGRQLGYAALAALEALPPPATRFDYTGPVISGATIGTWAHQPLEPEALEQKCRWHIKRWSVRLPYRSDLPGLEQTQKEMQSWQQQEHAARDAGDDDKARDCRAMVERMTRRLTRLHYLPPGEAFPYPITLWRMGDALWLAVEGELYNLFQRALRERFPRHPVIIASLTNGSRISYLPTADVYGKGIYQETIAVLAPGCLEHLLEVVGDEIRKMVD